MDERTHPEIPTGAASSMASYYARRAAEYERIYRKPERQRDLGELRKFLPRFFAGEQVLEIACGTGYWTQVISEQARSVMATDINNEVLEVARAKRMDPSRVVFRQADAWALPQLPGGFSAGLAAFWWSHLPRSRVQPFCEYFHRHLDEGAKVAWIDNVYIEGNSTPISRTDSEGNTYQARRLEDGSTFEVLKNFPSLEELREAGGQFGTEVKVEEFHYYWVLTYRARSVSGSRRQAAN
jgi:SAM-dependent methyltransferase